jgi:hypothetical protein
MILVLIDCAFLFFVEEIAGRRMGRMVPGGIMGSRFAVLGERRFESDWPFEDENGGDSEVCGMGLELALAPHAKQLARLKARRMGKLDDEEEISFTECTAMSLKNCGSVADLRSCESSPGLKLPGQSV